MSFPSKSPLVLDNQLKVQKLVVKLSDSFVSASAAVATISMGEPIKEVRSAIFCDDSGPTAQLIAQSGINLATANTIIVTCSATIAANDSIILEYVVDENA
jgi:hypothetical protein